MHIVFHTHEYPGPGRSHGGVGSVVKFLANRLVAHGIDVSIIGLNNSTEDQTDFDGKIPVYRIGQSSWKIGKFIQNTDRILKKLQEIHRQNPIDIVEGPELTFAFYPRKTPFKKVIRLHGGHHFFSLELNKKPRFWRSFQEKKSFRNADGFIAVSDYVGRQTRKYLKIPFDYEVIYNTLDTGQFHASDPGNVIPGRLLFVGTVCEKKGIRQLIQALPIVIEKHPEVHLDVVGRDWHFPDGRSYIDYLKKNYVDKHLARHITFHGTVPHNRVKQFIDQAEVCVYPSHMEACPMSWIEALLSAKPFIGSNIGPGKELVIHGKTGLLPNPYKPAEIAESILFMLEHKDKALEIGQAARRHLLEIIHPEYILSQNIRFYEKLLQS